MKFKLLTSLTLLSTLSFITPASAQNTSIQAQVSGDQVLAACAQDRADTLPNPFSDVSPNDWAYKAVLSLYYCGAYRGSIPPEQVKPFLQPQPSQPTSNQTPSQPNLSQSPMGTL